MKNRTKKVLIAISLLIVLSFILGGHLINKFCNNSIKKHTQMYCYENFRGLDKPVSVLIIEDLNLKDRYLKYYQDLESGNEPYLDNDIPLKGMPQYSPLYVIGYTKDSLLAEVVSYYNRGLKLGGNYTHGWVYAKTLHKEPPLKK